MVANIIILLTDEQAKRFHHSLTTLIVVIASISYFAMANKSGMVEHHRKIPEHHVDPLPPTHRHIFRDVYYARFVDWFLTTPLILLNLHALSGLNGASIFSTIAADFIMILTGWFAAVSRTKVEKWGW
jgi:bacteriorhodopsin